MSTRKSGSVENTLSVFVKLENELSNMKSEIEALKKKLLETAEKEGAKAKADCLTNAQREAVEIVESAKREAETQAREIEKKGETKSLEATIATKFEEAVDMILRSVTTA